MIRDSEGGPRNTARPAPILPTTAQEKSGDTVTTRETDTSGAAATDQRAEDHELSPTTRPWPRLGVSMLIVVILVAIVTSNAPDSTIKDGLLVVMRPVLAATGLDQRWGVFAPNPRLETSNVAARVDRADGTVGFYPLAADAGISEYWNYRWRKYGEQMWTQQSAERERVAFARWLADQDRAAGHQPVRVTLLRITRTNLRPGPGPDAEPWREVPFFTLPAGAR
jgi:hypothetical protein